MPPFNDFSDGYVAELLAKDAKASAKRYMTFGFRETLPKRPTHNAPKPNTRFLKTIIKETDSHNAALRAKESHDTRSRLQSLGRSNGKSRDGRLAPHSSDHRSKRRRAESDEDAGGERRQHRRRNRSCDRSDRSTVDHWEKRRKRRERGKRADEDKEALDSHHRHGRHYQLSHQPHGTEAPRSQRHRLQRTDHSRSRSPSPLRHRVKDHHRAFREPKPVSRENTSDCAESAISERVGHRSPSVDSDPLESIVGPSPPSPKPEVRLRGRGTATAGSNIDAHFARNYDPANDAHPDPEIEQDDWDQALEALRDRQKWQQRGAERLRAAGFSEDEVLNWTSGQNKDVDVERDENDVRWRGRGEGREWDRGKVVTSDGVATGAEWGRLKGS